MTQTQFPKFDLVPYQVGLTAFCRKWKVKSVSLYGSAAREDFSTTSDVDLLLAFFPDADPDLFDYVDMKAELEQLFGRTVDLANRNSIEQSRNEMRKREILGEAKVIYEEAA